LSMLHVNGENTVLSPQSLALALGMAAEGAQGETLDEILAALGVQDVSEISAEKIEGIKDANAAFVASGLSLKPEYVEKLNERYGAGWFDMDGDVVAKVNDWVKEHTDELIEELLSEAPAADIGMILVNALAMDADWAAPFSPEATTEEAFYAPGGDVLVQMMHQTEFFDYAEKDGMQIVRLPYSTGNLEMWIALPPEGGMHQLLEILANEGMFYLKSDAETREVILSLPKMDVSDDNTLADALKLLGVETAFADNADFTGISDTPLCVDEILQKVRVQVDEQGTKAAAATALMVKEMSAMCPEEPVEMNVNRPFAFVISDGSTGSVCFIGAIENPSA
ncbi:MAG: hypothetical protein J6J78_09605, partial [Clostridia bacterium]|nr:hypothetical protein [Clostridia bacterium]